MQIIYSRFKKFTYNLFFSFLNQFINIAVGIIIPRFVLISFGSEINGLLASVKQIYSYVNLLEAGVGTATIQALYKPVAENNRQSINTILSATDKYYKRAGMLYFIFVIIFAIAYPLVIKTEISIFIIVAVIVLNGLSGAINFYFQGKYRLLLQVEGKSYLIANLATIIFLLISISKIFLMILGYNVITLQLAYFLYNLLQTAYIMFYIKKNYSWIDLNVKPNKAAISQKSSVLVHQISGLVFNNTDVLLLSIFANLKVVSVYIIYNMLFSMIRTLTYNISSSINFAMGQIYSFNKKKFLLFHDVYEMFYITVSYIFYTIAYFFILPFMKLYTSGITDIDYIDSKLPILFLVGHLLNTARGPKLSIITFAGHFRKTQIRSVIESSINLIVSIAGVYYLGIYGVLIGTIAALLYRTNDIILYSCKHLLHISPLQTYFRILYNTVAFVGIVYAFQFFEISAVSYLNIIIWAFIYLVIVSIIYFLVAAIFELQTMKNAYAIVFPYFKRIFNDKAN